MRRGEVLGAKRCRGGESCLSRAQAHVGASFFSFFPFSVLGLTAEKFRMQPICGELSLKIRCRKVCRGWLSSCAAASTAQYLYNVPYGGVLSVSLDKLQPSGIGSMCQTGCGRKYDIWSQAGGREKRGGDGTRNMKIVPLIRNARQ